MESLQLPPNLYCGGAGPALSGRIGQRGAGHRAAHCLPGRPRSGGAHQDDALRCETMYLVNLLKTMSLLLRDSMEKALQYEELSRENRYVKDTDILKPEAFRKRVLLAEEKAKKQVAEYCVAELVYSGSLTEAASAVGQRLRVTDCLGTDGEGKLLALLNNTGPGNLEYLQKRLLDCGVEARPVPGEPSET